MKKTIAILLLVLSSGYILNAQIYTGLNTRVSLPVFGYEDIDVALGAEWLAGYSVTKKLDIHGSIANLWGISIIKGYSITSFNLDLRYNFMEYNIKPYAALGAGYFTKKIKTPLGPTIAESGIGISPAAGIQLAFNSIRGLYGNAELSYSHILTEHGIRLLNVSAGITYYFKKARHRYSRLRGA